MRFEMSDVPRTMDRPLWYKHWRTIRQVLRPSSADSFVEKEATLEQIRKHEQHGHIRLCDRFMDCDCATSTCSRLIKANYYLVVKAMNDIYDNAEGIGGVWITYPSDRPEPDHRDYALEAHEDGHPHSIHC